MCRWDCLVRLMKLFGSDIIRLKLHFYWTHEMRGWVRKW